MSFYKRRLAKQPANPQQPQQQVTSGYIQQQPNRQGPPVGNSMSHVAQMAVKAQDETGYCPNCGSGNFVGPSLRYQGESVTTDHGLVQAAARCFDCGYNPKMGGLLAGLGTPSGASGSQGTKQTREGGRIKNNYHGSDKSGAGIVGRVG